jgi:DNA-binding transcriptional LysR family regulator
MVLRSCKRDNPVLRNDIAELESAMSHATDMRVFVSVVSRGGFAAASKELGITASAVSKLVNRLEDRLGVRLLHRTTRRLALTPEGEMYHLRARDILAAIDDTEEEVSRAGQSPRGRLRVSCFTAFALHQLIPVMPDFRLRYPEIEIDLAVSDRVIDLLAENIDVGIRTGQVEDPSLVTRKIADIRRGLFASPKYLRQRGTPLTPEDLRNHDCIDLRIFSSANRWHFQVDGNERAIEVASHFRIDNGEAALRFAILGGGILQVADLVAAEALRDGRLKQVLIDHYVASSIPLSAVYPLGRHRMPKVCAFLDFLVERFGRSPWRNQAVAAKQRGKN